MIAIEFTLKDKTITCPCYYIITLCIHPFLSSAGVSQGRRTNQLFRGKNLAEDKSQGTTRQKVERRAEKEFKKRMRAEYYHTVMMIWSEQSKHDVTVLVARYLDPS